MGITYIRGTVRGPAGQEETLEFLVDSGAMYSLLPTATWQAIGLEPRREERFRLADGIPVTRNVSECYMVLDEGEGHSPMILGEPGDEALLGVVTLEVMGLVFNPFSRTLHPMRVLLA